MPDKYVILATVGKTHGVNGWQRVYSYTENDETLFSFSTWLLQKNSAWEEISRPETKVLGAHLLVRFAGCESPESAQAYVNAKIAVRREQLPPLPEGEYYWTDLEGLTVIDANGNTLGIVDYLQETGSNDIMIVKGETTLVIPYLLDEVITQIDLQRGIIQVNWSTDMV